MKNKPYIKSASYSLLGPHAKVIRGKAGMNDLFENSLLGLTKSFQSTLAEILGSETPSTDALDFFLYILSKEQVTGDHNSAPSSGLRQLAANQTARVSKMAFKKATKEFSPRKWRCLFEAFEKAKLLDRLVEEHISRPDHGIITLAMKSAYHQWVKNKDVALISPQTTEKPQSEVPEDIKAIYVANLLPPGESNEDAEDLPAEFAEACEGNAKDGVPRQAWLEEALKSHPDIDLAKCIIFKESLPQQKGKKPYSIFHVTTKDGMETQIAVCDSYGYATYAYKAVLDIASEPGVITIQDLREDLYVRKIRCSDKEDYVKNLIDFAFTLERDVQPQAKHNIHWANRRESIIEALEYFYLEHNRLPTYNDGIISHGPLQNKTRWDRVDWALQNHRVKGLQAYDSLKSLTDWLLIKDPTPEPPALS